LAEHHRGRDQLRPFREFRVWQAGHELTLQIYAATAQFPQDERFGLTSQIRRAASSVPFNIAEGSARSDAEFHQFLRISLGSASELEYALLLARDLHYLPLETYELLNADLLSIKRMLVTFMKTVNSPVSRAVPTPSATKARRAVGQPPAANGQQPGEPSR
jgi:four helix bundle protein